jgi:hypothetical protein
MTDEQIETIIDIVADQALEIATAGDASSDVCSAIEDLSCNPVICARLIETIRAALNASLHRTA